MTVFPIPLPFLPEPAARIVGALFEIIVRVVQAGDDPAKREEALMLAAERIAEEREREKFPGAS